MHESFSKLVLPCQKFCLLVLLLCSPNLLSAAHPCISILPLLSKGGEISLYNTIKGPDRENFPFKYDSAKGAEQIKEKLIQHLQLTSILPQSLKQAAENNPDGIRDLIADLSVAELQQLTTFYVEYYLLEKSGNLSADELNKISSKLLTNGLYSLNLNEEFPGRFTPKQIARLDKPSFFRILSIAGQINYKDPRLYARTTFGAIIRAPTLPLLPLKWSAQGTGKLYRTNPYFRTTVNSVGRFIFKAITIPIGAGVRFAIKHPKLSAITALSLALVGGASLLVYIETLPPEMQELYVTDLILMSMVPVGVGLYMGLAENP